MKAKPRTSGRFVTRLDAPEFKGGLDGRNIALWASHGRYFDASDDRWCWQRGRLLGTVEDLYSVSYVYPYLAPMLENAGAYVMMPRERDLSTTEVIVDNDGGLAQAGYAEKNGSEQWRALAGKSGFAYRQEELNGTQNPFRQGTLRCVSTVRDSLKQSVAVWSADMPERGEYALYVSYASLPESATDAVYRVHSMRGTEEFKVNQTMGGGTWVYLGTFPFDKGARPVVELSNVSEEPGRIVTADAVKIGGGMGNVVRGHGESAGTSGYPRFTEGARYWLQWAGMPESVYSITEGSNDYEDDYKSRGLWVNYLAGGSKSYPGKDGLGIPVDLSFALHTDAGITQDAMTSIGTLPIVSTAGGTLGDGRSRQASVKLGTMVTDQIVDDIWRLYDPGWTRRKLRNKSYHEAREPMVPAMLLELLSHQNFADMRLGLDPGFRFDVSRSIYKGILKYLHESSGTPYVVQPLPVSGFEITGGEGKYTLRWTPTVDRLEPSAKAEYYIVYERVGEGEFSELAITDDPWLCVAPEDDRIYSYKVVAANDGGISFPSETLSLSFTPGKPQILIVNGFTRVSGPTEVFTADRIGFDYMDDFGVPYVTDVMFTGAQTEFRPGQEWLSNDAPGHGASRATHETVLIAGNTFDYPYIHGEAIRRAGFSFISSGVDAFVKSDESPMIVDLILGKQKEIKAANMSGTRFKPFTQELKDRLSELCGRGTALMVSGSYVGSDLYDNPHRSLSETMSDRQFARDVLGIEWRQSQATVTGEVREVRTNIRQFDKTLTLKFNQALSGENYAVQSPESFIPAKGFKGAAVLRYTENDYPAGCAVILTDHKAFSMGFPFESI
ncbi:MAG: xanthan lyase, partial [Duncaniella sp.]|nr:xanthan lyase [Duncaniella sp.]